MIFLLALLLYPASFDLELSPAQTSVEELYLFPNESVNFVSNCSWVQFNGSIIFTAPQKSGHYSCSVDFSQNNTGIRTLAKVTVLEEFSDSFSLKQLIFLTIIIILLIYIVLHIWNKV